MPVTIAIRGKGTCEVFLPAARFDPFALIDLVGQHGTLLHLIFPCIRNRRERNQCRTLRSNEGFQTRPRSIADSPRRNIEPVCMAHHATVTGFCCWRGTNGLQEVPPALRAGDGLGDVLIASPNALTTMTGRSQDQEVSN